MNVVPEDNSEPYILFNGTIENRPNSVPEIKLEKLFYQNV
jgi:hypothetical protein